MTVPVKRPYKKRKVIEPEPPVVVVEPVVVEPVVVEPVVVEPVVFEPVVVEPVVVEPKKRKRNHRL